MSKSEIQAKIEYEQIIGEANKGGFQPIRFTRIKYKASETAHLDIRKFQRGYDDEGEEVFYPTKIGFRFPEQEFKKVLKEYALLPTTYIHPKIVAKSFRLLENGEYESAILQAFKVIETTIRERIGGKSEDIGVRLIRQAFNANNGQLTDFDLPLAEREAFVNYISGAYGFYKNPCSHRDVELDMISAFERIVVASDLFKKINPDIPF